MSNLYTEKRKELTAQFAQLMPLIEEERQAFIMAEGGRLAAVIGTGYWVKEAEDYEIFHGRKGDELALIEARPKDPYDITTEEIEWITRQYKKIERCGTETYINFFNMMPDDKERITLLAGMWHKLSHDTLCTDAEIKKLVDGHDEFINRKLSDPVKVISHI